MKKVISPGGHIYIQESFRNGSKVSTRTIKKLGRIDRLMDEFHMTKAEVLAWVDQQLAELEAEKAASPDSVIVKIPSGKAEKGSSPLKDTGYLFLQKICYELKLDKILDDIAQEHQFKFDLCGIALAMIYNRILNPASKRKCRLLSKNMIEPPVIGDQDIYRALDVLEENMNDILLQLYKNSNKVVKRNTRVLYYDCTNFYMEIEEARGELCQYGVSKENRPNPIVQMGLFLDEDGIPFDMNINPGNQNETLSVNQDTVKRITRDFEVDRFIYCADAGLGSSAIRKAVQGYFKNNDFIITHSIKKMPNTLKEWALDQSDQTWWYYWKTNPETGEKTKYKIRFKNIKQTPDNSTKYFRSRWEVTKDGREERYIVTYCPKYKFYLQSKREELVKRAEKKTMNLGLKKRKRQNDCNRYVKETYMTSNGEVAEEVEREIDTEQISKEEIYDGFYCVATTLDWEESEVLDICHKRWQIEDCFRVMKTYFDARPVYLQKDGRIKAHFLICFIALMVFRILEKRMENRFTSTQLLEALRSIKHYDQFGQGYSYAYEVTDVSAALSETFNLELDENILTVGKMKKIIKASKKRTVVSKTKGSV